MNKKETLNAIKLFENALSEYVQNNLNECDEFKDNPSNLDWEDVGKIINDFSIESQLFERDNEFYRCIYKVTNLLTNKFGYVMYLGDYDSWNGIDWEGSKPIVVEPYEVKVVQWREIE